MKTPLQELIDYMNGEDSTVVPFVDEKVLKKATELLEKEREIAQEYAKQSKQDEVNDNPHLGYKTALVPDELLKPQPQEKQEEVKCDQDNGLREALIDVQSLILDQGNYTYGAFNEMDHVKGILEKALNQNK